MDNIFSKSITEIIKSRHSVRTYENRKLSEEILEKVKCADLGLGTAWLGGTFNKSKFAEAINLKEKV